MVHGTWYVVHGTWYMVHGTLYMTHSAWYITWYMVHGTCASIQMLTLFVGDQKCDIVRNCELCPDTQDIYGQSLTGHGEFENMLSMHSWH